MLYDFFWVIPRRLNFICRRFGTRCSIFIGRWLCEPPAYEDGTGCSETSAYKIQTPGNNPEESIQKSQTFVITRIQFPCRLIHEIYHPRCISTAFLIHSLWTGFYFNYERSWFTTVWCHYHRNSKRTFTLAQCLFSSSASDYTFFLAEVQDILSLFVRQQSYAAACTAWLAGWCERRVTGLEHFWLHFFHLRQFAGKYLIRLVCASLTSSDSTPTHCKIISNNY